MRKTLVRVTGCLYCEFFTVFGVQNPHNFLDIISECSLVSHVFVNSSMAEITKLADSDRSVMTAKVGSYKRSWVQIIIVDFLTHPHPTERIPRQMPPTKSTISS